MTDSSTQTKPVIDVRLIAPFERHARIFATLEALAPGHSLQIVNDHDPQPLRQQLQLRFPDQYGWTYLELGPVWRVEIVRLSSHKCTCGNH